MAIEYTRSEAGEYKIKPTHLPDIIIRWTGLCSCYGATVVENSGVIERKLDDTGSLDPKDYLYDARLAGKPNHGSDWDEAIIDSVRLAQDHPELLLTPDFIKSHPDYQRVRDALWHTNIEISQLELKMRRLQGQLNIISLVLASQENDLTGKEAELDGIEDDSKDHELPKNADAEPEEE